MGLIVLNVLAMCTESRQQPESWTTVLRVLNYFFAWAFTMEAFLKVSGVGGWVGKKKPFY